MAVGASYLDETFLSEFQHVDHVPKDLHKLEWLVRLPVEDFRDFLRLVNARSITRDTIIKMVRERLGEDMDAVVEDVLTADKLRSRWTSAFERLAKGFDELPVNAARELLLEQCKESFAATCEVIAANFPDLGDDVSSEEGESDDESDLIVSRPRTANGS